MQQPASAGVTNHAIPSYLQADHLGPWGNYLQQVDRVTPTWAISPAGSKPSSAPSAS